MKRSRFSEEQIIGILKEHEAGVPVADLCRKHGVSDASIWQPYAPDLNPLENVWQFLRGNKLAITVFKQYHDIVDKTCDAWNLFAQDTNRIASIETRSNHSH